MEDTLPPGLLGRSDRDDLLGNSHGDAARADLATAIEAKNHVGLIQPVASLALDLFADHNPLLHAR